MAIVSSIEINTTRRVIRKKMNKITCTVRCRVEGTTFPVWMHFESGENRPVFRCVQNSIEKGNKVAISVDFMNIFMPIPSNACEKLHSHSFISLSPDEAILVTFYSMQSRRKTLCAPHTSQRASTRQLWRGLSGIIYEILYVSCCNQCLQWTGLFNFFLPNVLENPRQLNTFRKPTNESGNKTQV